MPLMMEADMDIDDLFGDGTGLSFSAQPPTKELFQRIDELRIGGCCQQIAWSKCGSIASVASNGYTLEIRFLRCHPKTGNWELSKPSTPSFTSTQDGGPIRHLSWSSTGCDLAVIDSAGRVTILSIFSSLNKLAITRNYQVDTADDLQTPVGSYWLPLAPVPPGRPTFQNGPGIKEGRGYRYETSQTPTLGPCNPIPGKSAFVFVTTNGLLKLLWPQSNNKWCDIHTELESIVSSDDLITHAAICPDKNQSPHGLLMIAFATSSKQLRTVRALIDWNIQKGEKAPNGTFLLNPTLKTRHLAMTSWAPEYSLDSMNDSQLDLSMVELSYLEFLPPAEDINAKMAPPTILAVKSCLPTSRSQFYQDFETTFERWEVREKPLSVNSAFEQLGGSQDKNAAQFASISVLKKIKSHKVNKIVIGLEIMNLGKIIFLAYSDGSVEYRERIGFTETFNDNNLNRVCHLSQIGYTYADGEPPIQVALSPTQSSLVYLEKNGKIKWKQLEYHLGQMGTSMEEPIYAATVAALSLSCGTAVMRNSNFDDLLAFASRFTLPQLAFDWLIELSCILKLHVDYSDENHHQLLIRNTTIQICLSVQNSLGFKGLLNARTFSGKNAWIVLQLRNTVVQVAMAAGTKLPVTNSVEKASPLDEPEIIYFLAGSIRWAIDLIAWIIDSLLSLPRSLPSNIDLTKASDLSLLELLAHLQSTNNISLHLILASSTRGFLIALNRRLQHLDNIAKKSLTISMSNTMTSPLILSALRTAYRQIATILSNSIIGLDTVEKFLTSISKQVKEAYSSYTPPLGSTGNLEKARNALEIKLLFGGPIPDALKPVIVELFKKDGILEMVRDEIDESRLFFADFTMLEVDDDKASLKKRKQMNLVMDCFKKLWIQKPSQEMGNSLNNVMMGKSEHSATRVTGKRQELKWRRCTRCAAISEDALVQRQPLQWLVMQQRRCFCSGYWSTLDSGETVA
ncbi:hypothetical protein EPUL_001131 [Erysiphe pulchra]|uniref:Mediator of RNA polymerase II transcription subunit 16 n=1 Tax=Erysiphe pulchra TaxID=225359 RepID=A0A2S4Q0G2_9PEZI|nr:hypothetical protein EPUL_001131 [Erysiphe pulchra]